MYFLKQQRLFFLSRMTTWLRRSQLVKCCLFEVFGYQENTRQMITLRVSEYCSSEELLSKTYSL